MKCDLHVHSNLSNDCCNSIDRIVKRAKKKGIDILAITNHNEIIPPGQLKKYGNHVVLISGAEYSTDVGHVLAIFCEKHIESYGVRKNAKGVYDHQEVIRAIHEMDGIAIYAHPFGRVINPSQDILKRFDGIEVYNSRSGYKLKGKANLLAQKAVLNHQYQTAGSDAHLLYEIGKSYVELNLANKNFTKEEFLEALKTGELFSRPTSAVASSISQMYKAVCLKMPKLFLKNILKFIYGIATILFPFLFQIKPCRKIGNQNDTL
ncbi:MAG: CehA/McbA family metallohydrolase [Bacillota bacterium]|nr:CehA/McbA family metallohydrolase [Bacillota bacterium]